MYGFPMDLATYMEDDEIELYSGILARDGREAADKYFDALRPVLTERMGTGIANSISDSMLKQGPVSYTHLNVFHVELRDNEDLLARYPQLEGKLGQGADRPQVYVYDDAIDTSKKSAMVDWYYKRDGLLHLSLIHICFMFRRANSICK